MKTAWTTGIISLILAASLVGCTGDKLTAEKTSEHSSPHSPREVSKIITLTPEALEQLNLQTLTVQPTEAVQTFETVGQIRADEERIFHVGSLVAGRLGQVNAKLGDTVGQGQVIAQVRNTEVPRIQANFIHELHQNEVDIRQAEARLELAKKILAREQRLYEQGIAPRKDLESAQNELAHAQIGLEGEQEHQIHIRAEAEGLLGAYGVQPNASGHEQVSSITAIRAPQSGVVIEKTITQGDVVQPQDNLFTIADLSRVWLDITLYPEQVRPVRVGTPVAFYSDSEPDRAVHGKINYLPPLAESSSKTYTARAFLENPQQVLQPGMMGRVTITLARQQRQLVVPTVAVHTHEGQSVVFTVQEPGRYQAVPVQTGPTTSEGMVITQGLNPGDTIVTKGSFTLKAEWLKDQLEGHGEGH